MRAWELPCALSTPAHECYKAPKENPVFDCEPVDVYPHTHLVNRMIEAHDVLVMGEREKMWILALITGSFVLLGMLYEEVGWSWCETTYGALLYPYPFLFYGAFCALAFWALAKWQHPTL
jgi:hypothetical protein